MHVNSDIRRTNSNISIDTGITERRSISRRRHSMIDHSNSLPDINTNSPLRGMRARRTNVNDRTSLEVVCCRPHNRNLVGPTSAVRFSCGWTPVAQSVVNREARPRLISLTLVNVGGLKPECPIWFHVQLDTCATFDTPPAGRVMCNLLNDDPIQVSTVYGQLLSITSVSRNCLARSFTDWFLSSCSGRWSVWDQDQPLPCYPS